MFFGLSQEVCNFALWIQINPDTKLTAMSSRDPHGLCNPHGSELGVSKGMGTG